MAQSENIQLRSQLTGVQEQLELREEELRKLNSTGRGTPHEKMCRSCRNRVDSLPRNFLVKTTTVTNGAFSKLPLCFFIQLSVKPLASVETQCDLITSNSLTEEILKLRIANKTLTVSSNILF